MYYFLIRFDGPNVTGFEHPGDCTVEQAVKDIKYKLVGSIMFKISKLNGGTDDSYHLRDIKKLKSELRSFKKPWRKNKKGFGHHSSPVLKYRKIEEPLSTNYWMDEIITQEHACNILAFSALTKEIENPAEVDQSGECA